ncbi:MAG: hypothetical protein R3C99_06985 [Pirellulaceae bacterium]
MSRLTETRAESRRIATHLDELQTELGNLQAEQLTALDEAESKRDEAEQGAAARRRAQQPVRRAEHDSMGTESRGERAGDLGGDRRVRLAGRESANRGWSS